MNKRYDAMTPRPKKDGTTFWHRIGTAFENEKGGLSIYFDSLPLQDSEGRCAVMLFEPRERQAKPAEQGAGLPSDDVPFSPRI